MTDKKLSEIDHAILGGRAHGVCIKGEWKWLIDSYPVTRRVNQFVKRGLLHLSYYSGGVAGAWPTEEGDKFRKAAL